MLSVAVVDDEDIFCDHIREMIQRYGQEHDLSIEITCFRDGIDITDGFQSRWDIIFLDIQMKFLNGLETARHIRACDSEVILIFITTLAQYAINGYEFNALDFILKPLEYRQLEMCMNKAVREAQKKEAHTYLLLKKWNDMVKISTDDILYIEVNGHTLRYVTREDVYEKRATIAAAEKELEGLPFSRCNLSFLVNLKKVDKICKDMVMVEGHQLPISRNRKKEFLRAFSDFLEAGFL